MIPPVSDRALFDWLLDPAQPSARYLTLRDVLRRPETDGEVRAARRDLPRTGWAAEILAQRRRGGWWVSPERLYRPKYVSSNWMLLVLADLGLRRELPAVERSAELWIDRFASADGGFGTNGGRHGHLCVVGNTARALIQFGYADHPRVRSALDWLVRNASPLGGWSCFGSGRNLDSWEGLSAFAAYPRDRWTAPMQRVVDAGVEFYLERELHRQGDRYAPWYRTHYPRHYYYDLLVGLDLVTALGDPRDRRLRTALAWLRKRRRADGRWNLDAIHPDVVGPIADWLAAHPNQRPTPFSLEAVGRPSKMITLTALRVLARVDGTA